MQQFDVFLSHNSIDKPWVSQLKANLTRYGLRAWLDIDEIRPGNLFAKDLEQALDHTRAVALIISPEAMASGWVEEEYYGTLSRIKEDTSVQLIPVLYKDAELPRFLKSRSWIDFRDPDQYALKVWELIWGITGQKPPQLLDLTTDRPPLPDQIPTPAPLPPGSRMPLSPNPLFVGREKDLKTLAQTLQAGQTAATPVAAIGQIAAATGLGGIGKTQLAAEFVHRYGQYFAGGVFWLSFADPAAIPADIAACGGPAHLKLWPNPDQAPDLATQLRLVRAAWRDPLPRLLVFDNCEEEELLAQWRPPTGGSRVLVTSRRGAWSAALGVQALPLGVLSRPESVALLHKHRPDLAEAEAEAIAEELGDLPLALHLAGSFLNRYQYAVTPTAYLAQLRGPALLEHPSLKGRGAGLSPTGHELHVARTFALSYDRLDAAEPGDALALALLVRAAYFAPGEPIPRALLVATVEPEEEPEASLLAQDALARLVELGLLEAEAEGALLLHRLLAKFARGLADEGAQTAVEQAIMREQDKHLDEAGYLGPLLSLQAHLRAVTNTAREREDETAAALCNRLGYYLDQIGDYAAARPYYERALAIREQVLGPEHPHTAQSLNNLALLLQAQGDYAGARPYYERALAIRQQVLGEAHPATARSLNNLGALLDTMGDYAGARPYFERALAIFEQVLGEAHPDTASSLNNLGALLDTMGDYAGARPYYERALAIRQQVLGEAHPDTATSLNNLGALHRAEGDYAGARPYYERALAIRQQVLGEAHPDTARSLNNLGALLDTMGDSAGARPYYERALAIRQQVLGEAHPDTAQSLNNLGALLDTLGDYAGARPYYERALAIYEQVLGEAHPDTARSLNNLGYLHQAEGDYAGARPYYERALAIRQQLLGEAHPDTASSLNNLASLLKAEGDSEAARPYFERALAIQQKVLGETHPDTAISLWWLGTLLAQSGDIDGARAQLQQALAIYTHTLGAAHPTTQSCQRMLDDLNQQPQ